MTAWNDFVKKIYHEGHNKDKSYSFKQALQDASKRKGEMGSSSASSSSSGPAKKSRKKGKKSKKMGKKSCKCPKSGGTRKRRKH
jgi:hypothetical protein